MLDTLKDLLLQQTDFLQKSMRVFVGILVSAVGLGTILALAAAFIDELLAPLRVRERTRLFLQLIEMTFLQGRPLEQTILSLSEMREKALGVNFHLLAAYLQRGLSLGEALQKIPAFVAPEVTAMLRVGEEIGDIRKVLPVCHQTLEQGTSKARTALNTSVIVLLVAPFGPAMLAVLTVWVFPKLKDIMAEFLGRVPPVVEMLFGISTHLAWVVTVLWFLVLIFGMGQKGGTGLFARFLAKLWPLTDRLNYWLPWRRRRMQRDFSSMLAILLDAEVHEPRAVQLAARSTANHIFMANAERARADLEAGSNLTEALGRLCKDREFQWRFRNASLHRNGFLAALAGWHEALEAKAFQQEQAFSHIVSTVFVFLNGLMVGTTAAGVFLVLLAVIEEAPLW